VVDKTLLASKLAELADRVQRVRVTCPDSVDELAADRDALEIVAFNLMLAVSVCADIAAHLIADQGWPVAQSFAQGFRSLAERGVVAEPTGEALCRAVALRNVVAHGYGRLNVAMVHAGATTGLSDLEGFAQEVAAWATTAS
jgi:uncharacterized protein YutE (UPF0331/DUF86 family)